MRWMHEHYPGLGFDCASEREINEALPICGNAGIIYAQPCKKPEDIQTANARGIGLTVADSVEEVEKLSVSGWSGDVLIRLLVKDGGSKQPFGKKFGAPAEWLPKMYEMAHAHKLNMTGFSFHVGSECQDPKQYESAIADCKKGAEIAKHYGYKTSVIDIGGGFVPDATMFTSVAKHVRNARDKYFSTNDVRFIAEPGRFFAAPTHTLYTTIIGKKPVWPIPDNKYDPLWRITIDESVYGSFSNIPFDGQKPVLENMRDVRSDEYKRPTIVFGRTCDSGDFVGNIPLYDVNVGDVLRVKQMGAYTTVTASEFNGFPKPAKFYDF